MAETAIEATSANDKSATWIERVVSLLDGYPMTPTAVSMHMFPAAREVRALTTEARTMLRETSTRQLTERMDPIGLVRAIASTKVMRDQLTSLLRSFRRDMHAVTDEDQVAYTRFLTWLYCARCGAVPTFDCTFLSTYQCMAPTKKHQRCKHKMQSRYGAHLPGTCRIHTPSHAEFVSWLNTEEGGQCLPHFRETNDLWVDGRRIARAIEELSEECEEMAKISVVAPIAVPDEIREEWDQCDLLIRAFDQMNRAVEQFDTLHKACHEWATDHHATCPVCMEFLSKDRTGTVKLRCGHELCVVCFKGINSARHRSNMSCPVCRSDIP